ncbi:MAG TPA: redox-sensing transcriptional repressor Rex [Candidatus Scatosoma pullistercoris]|uniref:Redox-sensing transcriptional repressor Rex n=1 Tax=Candidatus Scatosoma pullistercoris TaxID=2840934 RepID=A0A9D1MFP6_9FIRM|nr:redox-sensing transcriptional repressor Rex [Candidatus Scatosoma pullistercoris]
MNVQEMSRATIGRMPLYLRFLQEENQKGERYISSAVIAQNIPVSAVLVRKDLALVSSQPGKPRLGFEVVRLIADIEKFLGYDNLSDAVIVGAGGLGKAFLGYEGFKNNGLNVVAAFDISPEVIGERIAGKTVYPLEEFERFVAENKINIGIITVPKSAAQETLDRMARAGIKAVWNFAPAPLHVPKGVIVKNEDLSASLALLAGELTKGGF